MNIDENLENLLREFDPIKNRVILVAETTAMSEEEATKLTNVGRLCDLGLMTKISTQGYRMTEAGHAHLATIMNEGV